MRNPTPCDYFISVIRDCSGYDAGSLTLPARWKAKAYSTPKDLARFLSGWALFTTLEHMQKQSGLPTLRPWAPEAGMPGLSSTAVASPVSRHGPIQFSALPNQTQLKLRAASQRPVCSNNAKDWGAASLGRFVSSDARSGQSQARTPETFFSANHRSMDTGAQGPRTRDIQPEGLVSALPRLFTLASFNLWAATLADLCSRFFRLAWGGSVAWCCW